MCHACGPIRHTSNIIELIDPMLSTMYNSNYHNQVVADSNFKYVLEIKDVPKFKDAST